MAKQLKVVTAGPLVYEYLVPVVERGDAPKVRKAKEHAITEVQRYMNLKNSWRTLELSLARNFAGRDMVVTFTYDDEHLPADKKEAGNCFTKFIRKLRTSRTRRGAVLKYVYVTEGFHSKGENDWMEEDGSLEDKRLHHHAVINCTGAADYEELHSLWGYGGYIRIEPLDIHYYKELAKYLTKEARDFQKPKLGERTWRASRNLEKHTVEYDNVRDNLTLSPPPGAVDYECVEEKNPYGYASFVFARYLLLPEEPEPVYSYTAGRKRS